MSTLDIQNLALGDLIDPDASVERIAGGLGFTEGPRGGAMGLFYSVIFRTIGLRVGRGLLKAQN
ncbi:MAG: hypothetical protein CM1200mP22_33640 [Dehalococcoidia bacterium]|nr:MAG: hypothetical protein CM1200mP22_33640 [Dehalococcoidia bacterium]